MSGARNWDKTEDTVLYTKWDWAVYNLRDTGPARGLIFYINPNAAADGWKYLECAPQSTEYTNKQWGKQGYLLGTKEEIGTGKNNTALIVNGEPGASNKVAQLCDALIYNGYDDWFLPSRYELNQMYVNLHQQGVGGFGGSVYFTSSETGVDLGT